MSEQERSTEPDSIDVLLAHAQARRHGTIVVADLVESVRLYELDDAGTAARWQALADAIVRRVLPAHGGRLVKSLGDGLMLAFDDVRPAVAAAIGLQAECARHGAGVPPDRRLWFRVGVNLGEHVADARDVYGHSVNLAARLATVAGPGEIVVSADVRDRVVDGLDASLEDLGECWLKHVSHPVRAYRIGAPGPNPLVLGPNITGSMKPTIAVIPFAGRMVSAEHAVLGDVIADGVISTLSRTPELDVISRLSTTAISGRELPASEIGSTLGAGYVLSGSYAVSGARVSIKAELCDARDSKVVWSDALRARTSALVWGDDPAIERLVAEASAAVIARELTRARTQALPTLEAFTLLMSAIALMHRLSASEFARARDMLETVVDRAPRQAEPQAWLAKWHVLRVHQGWSADAQTDVVQAQDRIRRALDADSHCSLALAVDGLVQTSLLGRLDLAQASYEQALDVNPNDSLAWLLYGTLHAFRGEGGSAVMSTRRALRLSPLDPLRYYYDSLAASAETVAGNYDEAIRMAQRSLRANRSHTSTYRALAIAQSLSGRAEDARRTIGMLRTLEPSLTASGWLARSPTREYSIGPLFARALRDAGLPP